VGTSNPSNRRGRAEASGRRRPRRVLATAAALVAVASAAQAPASAGKDFGLTVRMSVSSEGVEGNLGSGAYDPPTRFSVFTFTLPAPFIIPGTFGAGHDPRNDSQPAVSATGRWVAFSSRATNLIRRDTNDSIDIFVRDRDPDGDGRLDAGGAVVTTRMSVSSSGAQSNGDSIWPAMSTDGRFVAFVSSASNLVQGDANGLPDVFVRDRDPDGNGLFDENGPGKMSTVLASLRSDGTQVTGLAPAVAGGAVGAPAISDNGRWVVFTSWARLTADDGNVCGPVDHPDACADVFIRDVTAGTTSLVSAAEDGTPGNAASGTVPPVLPARAPAMTPDGRFITFHSAASNLTPNDVNEAPDIFVRDRDSDGDGIFDEPGGVGMSRVEAPARGSGRYRSFNPSISADGHYVAFQGVGSNHTINDLDLDVESRIFVHDRVAGTTVSLVPNGAQLRGESRVFGPSISGSGRFVAFTGVVGTATALADRGDVRTEVFMHDRDNDADGVFDEADPGATATLRVSFGRMLGSGAGGQPGEPPDGSSYGPTFARAGDFITYISFAGNLTGGIGLLAPQDHNTVADVFVWRRGFGLCVEVACVS
jgi:Tol biopolymer transport system component